MDHDTALQSKLLEMIQAGKLPARHPQRMWGGYGQGEPCALCSQTVKEAQMGIEAEFANPGGNGHVSHYFHTTCFSIMEAELKVIERNTRAPYVGEMAMPTTGQAVQTP